MLIQRSWVRSTWSASSTPSTRKWIDGKQTVGSAQATRLLEVLPLTVGGDWRKSRFLSINQFQPDLIKDLRGLSLSLGVTFTWSLAKIHRDVYLRPTECWLIRKRLIRRREAISQLINLPWSLTAVSLTTGYYVLSGDKWQIYRGSSSSLPPPPTPRLYKRPLGQPIRETFERRLIGESQWATITVTLQEELKHHIK